MPHADIAHDRFHVSKYPGHKFFKPAHLVSYWLVRMIFLSINLMVLIMGSISMTKHAAIRKQQCGMSELAPGCLLEYGEVAVPLAVIFQ